MRLVPNETVMFTAREHGHPSMRHRNQQLHKRIVNLRIRWFDTTTGSLVDSTMVRGVAMWSVGQMRMRRAGLCKSVNGSASPIQCMQLTFLICVWRALSAPNMAGTNEDVNPFIPGWSVPHKRLIYARWCLSHSDHVVTCWESNRVSTQSRTLTMEASCNESGCEHVATVI